MSNTRLFSSVFEFPLLVGLRWATGKSGLLHSSEVLGCEHPLNSIRCPPPDEHPTIGKRSRYVVAVVSIASMMNFVCFAQTQLPLTHHVPQPVLSGLAKPAGHLPADETLRLVLTLPNRNHTELESFIQAVSDPSSPSYHHYLTVEQFTAKFGPSQKDYDTLINFAKTKGFTVVRTSRNRLNLEVDGTVSKIENTFHLHLNRYQHPSENRTFYAPDREPTADLSIRLWHITGLTDYSNPQPALSKRPAALASSAPSATTGSGPSASFLGSDMRAAYYGGTALTGSGQSVGLLEFRGADLDDLNTYFQNIGQTNGVPITLVSTDGTSTNCLYAGGCDDTEPILDITQAIGMAPGLSSLVMYVGSSDASLLNAMATANPLNAQLSISWAWTPADPTTDDPFFMEFAAQGQSVFAAAGDSGAWSSSTTYVFPSDDPYVTSVGGTDLQTSSAAGPWSSETAWVDGGGGISPDFFPIPDWQTTAVLSCPLCSTAYRNGPDVAANANWSFYVCSNQTACTTNYWGGTSFAAPMWAGYMALANQEAAAQGIGTVGFVNPALYTLAGESGYSTDFHDITSGSNGDAAAAGYDLATGLGSPDGTALIDALTIAPNFGLSAGSTSLTVGQGGNGSTSITTNVFAGFNSAINLSAAGQPIAVTVTFSSSSFAAPGSGSTNMTVTVASTVAPGTYPITVTGTGGGLAQSVTVSLVVMAPTFSLSASPASISAGQGNSGTSLITTSALYGFNSAITLTAGGQPAGVTVTFSPSSFPAPGSGSSTMALAVGSTVAPGTYPITVTGTGGSLAHSVTVSLVVMVPTFSLSASPASVSIVQGNRGASIVTTTALYGFNSAIVLSASGQPAGITVSFSPTSIAAPGNGTSQMIITVVSAVAAGTYPITVTGTSGSIVQAAAVYVTVALPPDFTMQFSGGNSVQLIQGEGATMLLQTNGINGFYSTIALSASGEPAGVTVSFNPAVVPAPGNDTVYMTISVSSTTAPGAYPIVVSGTGELITHTITVTLTVVAAPDFTLSATLSSPNVYQGSGDSFSVQTAALYGFNSQISLSVSGQPAGVSVSYAPAFFPAPGSGSGTISLAAAPNTAPGTYPITITASGTGLNNATVTHAVTANVTVLAAPTVGSVDFNPVNIGATSSAMPFTVTFNSAAQLGSTSVVTQGAPGLDFADAGTGTCTANTSYSQGQSCTIDVVFSPTVSGPRYGAVVLNDPNGNEIATGLIAGNGVGPQISFLPGSQSQFQVNNGPVISRGIAVDGSGNVFVAEDWNKDVKEILAVNGKIPASPPVKEVAAGFKLPWGLALDGSGNLYVADAWNNSVVELLKSSGYSAALPLGGGFSGPEGIAVDGNGNVFVADDSNNQVKEIPAGCTSSSCVRILGSGFTNPASVAVDATGNVFALDGNNNAVKEILAAGGYTTVRALAPDVTHSQALALDGQGNLYVADYYDQKIYEILKAGGYTTLNTMNETLSSDDGGLAVSGAGNVYASNGTVSIFDFADPPSLTFANTPYDTTSLDSPQTVTLTNIGNADLILPIPASGSNPIIGSNFTLDDNAPSACPVIGSGSSAPGTLAAGASCTLSVSFTPAALGNLTGSLVLTDNNLNAAGPAYTSQVIGLSGTGLPAVPAYRYNYPPASPTN